MTCPCRFLHVCVFNHVRLFANPQTEAHWAPLSIEFSRQKYWNGLPFPTPGNLPDPGIEPMSPVSPALGGRVFTAEPPGKPPCWFKKEGAFWRVVLIKVEAMHAGTGVCGSLPFSQFSCKPKTVLNNCPLKKVHILYDFI